MQIVVDIPRETYRITIENEEIDKIKSQDDFNALICRISQLLYQYIKEH